MYSFNRSRPTPLARTGHPDVTSFEAARRAVIAGPTSLRVLDTRGHLLVDPEAAMYWRIA